MSAFLVGPLVYSLGSLGGIANGLAGAAQASHSTRQYGSELQNVANSEIYRAALAAMGQWAAAKPVMDGRFTGSNHRTPTARFRASRYYDGPGKRFPLQET